RNFLRYREGPEAWIVDRFVCSSGHLSELLIELRDPGKEAIEVAVVGTAAHDHHHWGSGLEIDAAAMERFRVAADGQAEIVAFEIKVPDHAHVPEYLRDLRAFDEA